MSTQKLPEAALFYAWWLNWSILPLKPDTKTPATAHGFKDASSDAATVRGLGWNAMVNANVGLATGDVIVLDFDVHKLDYAGAELLTMLLKSTRRPRRTRRAGGVHLFFAQRPGLQLTNSTGALPAGVDVRGHGGYAASPSRFVYEGGLGDYTWRKGWNPGWCSLRRCRFSWSICLSRGEDWQATRRQERVDDVIVEFNRTHGVAEIDGAWLRSRARQRGVDQVVATRQGDGRDVRCGRHDQRS